MINGGGTIDDFIISVLVYVTDSQIVVALSVSGENFGFRISSLVMFPDFFSLVRSGGHDCLSRKAGMTPSCAEGFTIKIHCPEVSSCVITAAHYGTGLTLRPIQIGYRSQITF